MNQPDSAHEERDILKLKRENKQLKSSLKELQAKITELSSANEIDESSAQKKLHELKEHNNHLKQYVSGLECELESCQKNVHFLQDVLKQQIVGGLESTEELLAELDKVEDPFAIVLINRIINTYNKPQNMNKTSFKSRQTSNPEQEASVYKALEDSQKRVKRLELDKKTMIGEIDVLKTQNDVLTKQLEFAQRRFEPRDRKSYTSASSQAETVLSQVCEVFGIRDQNNMLECVEKIYTAYQFLPSLQNTVEAIYTIVAEKSCMPVECNSNEQLVEVIENWASNLVDYQNLVVDLFDVMKISGEDQKNRTHILQSIKHLMDDRSDIENMVIDGSEALEELKKLKKKSIGVDFFVEEAKAKLGLDGTYSNEALFSKVLKSLGTGKAGNNDVPDINE